MSFLSIRTNRVSGTGFFVFSGLLLLSLWGCDAEPLSIDDFLDEHYTEFSVLGIVEPDMSAEYSQEYVVFLEDPVATRMSGLFQPPSVAKVIAVFVEGKRLSVQTVRAGTIGFGPRQIETIESFSEEYGIWHGYCYISDVNGDGYDELITFHLSGFDFSRIIWTYEDQEFSLIEYWRLFPMEDKITDPDLLDDL